MRLLLLLLCSLSIFTIHAQADEILLEPDVVTDVEITESDLEIDVFFDAEVDQIIQVVSEINPTNEKFNLDRVAIYTPDGEELMLITRFYFSSFTFEPFRVTVGGRYRVQIIAKESARVEIRYMVRKTPDFGDSNNSTQDGLFSMVEWLDFTFTAEAGEIITSYVMTKSFDAVLTLYDPNGDVIATDDDSLGELNPIIDQVELVSAGKYRLVVHSYNPDGEGQFTIVLQHNPPPTNNIEYGEPLTVTFNEDITYQGFQFDGSVGDVLALHIHDPDNVADVRIERSVDYGRIIVSTDESATRLYKQWDRFVLPSNHTYRLYITSKEEGKSGEVTVQVEHIASRSLEAGEISVHVSDKDPIQYFTFAGYSNSSATVTINQSNYDAASMPYRVTVLTPSGSIINQMTIDNFVGSFSQTNSFGIGPLPNGEVTIEIEMLGDGPAWFDVSVAVVSGMG